MPTFCNFPSRKTKFFENTWQSQKFDLPSQKHNIVQKWIADLFHALMKRCLLLCEHFRRDNSNGLKNQSNDWKSGLLSTNSPFKIR